MNSFRICLKLNPFRVIDQFIFKNADKLLYGFLGAEKESKIIKGFHQYRV